MKISGVYGIGLSEIVACYVDNSLTREQCLRVAYIIGQTIEEHSRHSGISFMIIDEGVNGAFELIDLLLN